MEKSEITHLHGSDMIRMRPAVFFSSSDVYGAQHAVQIILNLFAAEAQFGNCTHLSVKQTGADLEISGDDHGLYLGQDSNDDKAWKRILCEPYIYQEYPLDDGGYSFEIPRYSHDLLYRDEIGPDADVYLPEDINSTELYLVQYVSKYMDVIVARDGIKSTLHFRDGRNVDGIINESTTESNGTYFRFALDPSVFSETVIAGDYFKGILNILAMSSPGLRCSYLDTECEQQECFFFPNGSTDHIRRFFSPTLPVYSKSVCTTGKERQDRVEYSASIRLVIGCLSCDESLMCVHNFRELKNGGTHWEQAKSQICYAFNNVFHSCITGLDLSGDFGLTEDNVKKAITFDELKKFLAIDLISWCTPGFSVWENGTRCSIENKVITRMVLEVAGEDFCDYVCANKEKLRPMIDAILAERKGKYRSADN